jgi:pimeloyl-ACP methyl ester carboxylesterase
LLPLLAARGYRAVAPFLRGYAPTDVPRDGRYQTGVLAQDALALHDVLGGDGDAVIIGHDWGALAAYGAASFEPDRWRRCIGLAVPPGRAVAEAFLTYAQLRRSWYMFFFQTALAERVVGRHELAFVDALWIDWSPGYDASGDLPLVKQSLRQPENLTAALGYYRALLGEAHRDPALAAIQAATTVEPPIPVLYCHGRRDGCMGIEVAEAVRANGTFAPGSAVELFDKAGHFLHLERPEVNARILQFLG